MGRSKKSRAKKRKETHSKREKIRLLMNKRIFFTLTKCPKKLKGISNKYCYKANMHGLIFKNAFFQNVRYKSSIITKCNFRQASLIGVDFCNCNLKKSSFKNAKLKDVCFINCNISNTDFTDADFNNVIFVCTCLDNSKNLIVDSNCKIYNKYSLLDLQQNINTELLSLSDYPEIYNSHVLHISKTKLNHWSLRILQDMYGADALRALVAIKNKKQKKNFTQIAIATCNSSQKSNKVW